MPKRKRVSSKRAVRTSMRVGNWGSLARASRARAAWKRNPRGRLSLSYMNQRLNSLTRTIETKEGCRRITNVQLAHNNLIVFNDSDGNVFNPFISSQGAADPMAAGGMSRVGDKITVQGVKLKFFIETSLTRSNTMFKFFFVKMAKGDTLNRANFFKDACNNKMIDQVNTERFTILASKTVRVTTPNNAPSAIAAITGLPTGTVQGIGGTRIISMWIPGAKFGRNGVVTYENASFNQLKFFDYRLCCVAYDWYGTPQDTNNVGFVNDGYCKTYFKDA